MDQETVEELQERVEQQSKVVELLKCELEDLEHRRAEFVQLVVQLQRKGLL